ncbi:MAG TPA: T9SS type A sorting domain-containing protein, partial [Adhaeribacter sp.]|nr:T9SS type A sorting domain-containing protein [Adhaeribacter sp.]
VYPNPASDHVTLAGNFEFVSVRNATGQLIMEKAGQPGETRLELGHLAAGLYLLQVQTKNSTYTHKLIIKPN